MNFITAVFNNLMNTVFNTKRLGNQDVPLFQKLIHLFGEVFEMEDLLMPSASYLLKLLEKPDFFAYVILAGNEIAGGLTAYQLTTYYNEGAEIYIYDIAIKPAFQRQGLGRQLLASLKEYCKHNSIRVMFVEAAAADEHAVEFYHATGGNAENVIHFNYYLDQ